MAAEVNVKQINWETSVVNGLVLIINNSTCNCQQWSWLNFSRSYFQQVFTTNLKVEQASLTGEAAAVSKVSQDYTDIKNLRVCSSDSAESVNFQNIMYNHKRAGNVNFSQKYVYVCVSIPDFSRETPKFSQTP